jgi:hypothetical protein
VARSRDKMSRDYLEGVDPGEPIDDGKLWITDESAKFEEPENEDEITHDRLFLQNPDDPKDVMPYYPVPVPNTNEYNDGWQQDANQEGLAEGAKAKGWGEKVNSDEVSEAIPESYRDKYKFPDYDKAYWKIIDQAND